MPYCKACSVTYHTFQQVIRTCLLQSTQQIFLPCHRVLQHIYCTSVHFGQCISTRQCNYHQDLLDASTAAWQTKGTTFRFKGHLHPQLGSSPSWCPSAAHISFFLYAYLFLVSAHSPSSVIRLGDWPQCLLVYVLFKSQEAPGALHITLFTNRWGSEPSSTSSKGCVRTWNNRHSLLMMSKK